MAEVPSGSVSVLAESDKCKHVDIVDVREGETLDKESINQTAKNWDDASDNVCEEHIREEGLDRRVFDHNGTWADPGGSSSRCYVSSLYDAWTPGAGLKWHPIYTGMTPAFNINGGLGGVTPKIEFGWDPQVHTYAIIRASLWFRIDVGMMGDSGRSSAADDGSPVDKRRDQDFKFGIHVTGPGEDEKNGQHVRRLDNPNGRIYCPVQVGLNRNWSDITYPSNDFNQYTDRRCALASTITMAVAGQSWNTDSAPNVNGNLSAIDMREAGNYKAQLMWRSRRDLKTCDISGSKDEGENVKCQIGHIQFFVQLFRR